MILITSTFEIFVPDSVVKFTCSNLFEYFFNDRVVFFTSYNIVFTTINNMTPWDNFKLTLIFILKYAFLDIFAKFNAQQTRRLVRFCKFEKRILLCKKKLAFISAWKGSAFLAYGNHLYFVMLFR